MGRSNHNAKIIEECFQTIISYLMHKVGKKNIVSLILTGSLARNQESYKTINGVTYIESDVDLILVVNRKALLKSLILARRLSKKLTSELRKTYLLSHVSFAVTTEHSLIRSPPSIFYHDIANNGKVLFGKEICKNLIHYDIQKIPDKDIYILIFNRMVETLENFVEFNYNFHEITKENVEPLLYSIRKLTFALIQAILIKKGILVFNRVCLDDNKIKKDILINSKVLVNLIDSYDELTRILSQENFSLQTISKCWKRVIEQFKETVATLSHLPKVTSLSVENLFKKENLRIRLVLAIIRFLQNFGMSSSVSLLNKTMYVIRGGSYAVYSILFSLFLSSVFIINDNEFRDNKNDIKNFSKELNLDETSFKNNWKDLFHKYHKIWSFTVGF